ncbi:MAG: hypothetical protein ACWGSQ_09915 [Longimicrobiales bacterium]
MNALLTKAARRSRSGAPSPRRNGLFLVSILLLPGLWGCDDDPFKIMWELRPDTILLYSLARPEMNLNSAFDFVRRNAVRVEAPSAVGEWDVAVDTQNGAIVLVPPGAIGVAKSKAGIALIDDETFDEIRRAPSDTTLYVRDRPVPMQVGQLYVIRTRQKQGSYGSVCVYYGKFEPLYVDPEEGRLSFMYDVSPVCNDRKLVPPKK